MLLASSYLQGKDLNNTRSSVAEIYVARIATLVLDDSMTVVEKHGMKQCVQPEVDKCCHRLMRTDEPKPLDDILFTTSVAKCQPFITKLFYSQ